MHQASDQAKERIRESEDRSIEIIHSSEQKEKQNKKKETESKYLRDTIKHTNIHTMALPEKDRGWAERIIE